MLVDAETLQLVPAVADACSRRGGARAARAAQDRAVRVRRRADHRRLRDTADEAAERLSRAPTRARRDRASRTGSSSRPPARIRRSNPPRQEIAPVERYREFVEYAGASARRQGVNGLHVHVGMPSAETLFRALEGVLPWLPVVLALSANSPYLAGRETGLPRTARRSSPSCRAAAHRRRSASYADWEAFVERIVGDGVAGRLHALLVGRAPAPALRHARGAHARPADGARAHGGFVALLHALCAWALESPPRPSTPASGASTSRTAGPRRASARDGELIHPRSRAERRRCAGARARAAGPLHGLDPERMRGRPRSSRSVGPGAPRCRADLVERSVASAVAVGRDDPGHRDPLRALRPPARAACSRATRASRARTPT